MLRTGQLHRLGHLHGLRRLWKTIDDSVVSLSLREYETGGRILTASYIPDHDCHMKTRPVLGHESRGPVESKDIKDPKI